MTEMPEVFDRLAVQVQDWARDHPDPPDFELSSKRELTCTGPDGRVEVAMKDFKVASIHVDDAWFAASMPTLQEIEASIRGAVNLALQQYWEAELAEAKELRLPMGEIAVGVQQLALDFRGAFSTAVARLEAHA